MTYVMPKPDVFDPRLRIGDKLGEVFGYRSVYPIFRDDDLIAFLTFPYGFRGKWSLHAIRPSERTDAYQGYGPQDHYSHKVRLTLGYEYALNELTRLLADADQKYAVKFPTKSEQEASSAAFKKEMEAAEEKYWAGEIAAQEAREARLKGLQAIMLKCDLHGDESLALKKTIDLLQAEVDHHAKEIAERK